MFHGRFPENCNARSRSRSPEDLCNGGWGRGSGTGPLSMRVALRICYILHILASLWVLLLGHGFYVHSSHGRYNNQELKPLNCGSPYSRHSCGVWFVLRAPSGPIPLGELSPLLKNHWDRRALFQMAKGGKPIIIVARSVGWVYSCHYDLCIFSRFRAVAPYIVSRYT
jgi:hypothetical protein